MITRNEVGHLIGNMNRFCWDLFERFANCSKFILTRLALVGSHCTCLCLIICKPDYQLVTSRGAGSVNLNFVLIGEFAAKISFSQIRINTLMCPTKIFVLAFNIFYDFLVQSLSEWELLERVKEVSAMPVNMQQSSTDLTLLNADLMDMDFTDNLFSSLDAAIFLLTV